MTYCLTKYVFALERTLDMKNKFLKKGLSMDITYCSKLINEIGITAVSSGVLA